MSVCRGTSLQSPATLAADDYIVSADGIFFLVMQGDANLVSYANVTVGPESPCPVWAAGTSLSGTTPYFQLGSDGSMAVLTSSSSSTTTLWTPPGYTPPGQGDYIFTLRPDGSPALYTSQNGQPANPVWEQTSGISIVTYPRFLVFTNGAIQEDQLEPGEAAFYQFDVVNTTGTNFREVTIGVTFDAQQFDSAGLTLQLPMPSPGLGTILVPVVEAGTSVPVSFTILTSTAATVGTYGFGLVLLGASGEGLSFPALATDSGQEFTVSCD